VTRVIVVHPDLAVATEEAAPLIQAGYAVNLCAGPAVHPCPVLTEQVCPLADAADVLVYDAIVAGPQGGPRLFAELREVYADLPVVLTVTGDVPPWVETEGPYRVTPIVRPFTHQQLIAAIEGALADQGMAV